MSGQQRALGAAALGLGAAAVALGVIAAVQNFPRGLFSLALVVLAVATAWNGLLRRRVVRGVLLVLAVALVAAAVVLLLSRAPVITVLVVVCAAGAVQCARLALVSRVRLPPADRPSHPVLIFNPRSGGGKATRFHLADEARRRGIEPVEMSLDLSLETTVAQQLARGADALAMAGGDGSQAVVAEIAAREELPYACIPAGTRNHFALDLGVDRDDVVGALDAFVNGGERIVDLAEVNGRVFVNNVSLGLYGDAVQRAGYRDAKLRTILDVLPDVAGPEGRSAPINWHDSEGLAHDGGLGVLVSNNVYRLGRLVGSGTRPQLDAGRLGVAVMGTRNWRHRGIVRQSSPRSIEVDGAGDVPAGIDGEAALLTPPIRFRSRPQALRVRIAPGHPGCSPSAGIPTGLWSGVGTLARIAVRGAR
ncbi:MAG TPA: diacylglycerol kinase family protein [Solirubrobacteraceae bacterium]|nr:diacylglycerol kinase family protein [Solirubrobacteraceae bacterium]